MSKSSKSVCLPHTVCLGSIGWSDGRCAIGARTMAVVGPVVSALLQASVKPADRKVLRARLGEQFNAIWISVPRDPDIPPHLRNRISINSGKLPIREAEIVVEALEKLAGRDDEMLQQELLALRLTIARLGGVYSALWIGRRVVEELRNCRSDAAD